MRSQSLPWITVLILVFSNTDTVCSDNKVGFSGALSTLDGGLSGTVTVQSANTLLIKNYQLGDGGAPALYWWGSTTSSLRSGFRISEERVSKVSDGEDLQVSLDAGKTTADFTVVGLWCERFGINYGQTTLVASSSSDSTLEAGSTTTSNSIVSSTAISSPSTADSSSDLGNTGNVAVLRDPYDTARAYFFCVLGLVLIESCIYLPSYLKEIFARDKHSQSLTTRHSRAYLWLLRICTLPSPVSWITIMTVPDLARLAVLLGLNILWGWNRNKYSADFDLYGWLTLANGGLALLFGARNNLLAIVLQVPSTSLLFYHRWVGRATAVHATIHMANLIHSYVQTGQFATVLRTLRIQVGLMAFVSLWLMAIFSINPIRRHWFEAFYYVHALFALFVIGALIHATHAPEFIVPGLALWVIDRLIRFQYNFRPVRIVSVTQYPGDLTKFKIQGVSPHRPAQVAWVQIPGVSLFNWHPFTIASPPSLNKEAVFAIRKQGNYTKRVQHIGITPQEKTSSSEARQMSDATDLIALKIRVDGPYGVGKIQWGTHPLTIIVAGGSGITPGISIAGYLLQRAKQKAARQTSQLQSHVQILWVLKESAHIAWFEEELVEMLTAASDPSVPITLGLGIHVTGSGAKTENGGAATEMGERSHYSEYLYKNRHVYSGRPDLRKFFQGLRSQYFGVDAAVSVCGPPPLVNAVRREAVAGDACMKGQGAYYVEAETFQI